MTYPVRLCVQTASHLDMATRRGRRGSVAVRPSRHQGAQTRPVQLGAKEAIASVIVLQNALQNHTTTTANHRRANRCHYHGQLPPACQGPPPPALARTTQPAEKKFLPRRVLFCVNLLFFLAFAGGACPLQTAPESAPLRH